MKTRIFSGLIMLPLLVILYFGGYVLLAACFVIGIMGVKEFYGGFEKMGVKPNFAVAVAAAAGLYLINIFTEKYEWYMLWFFGVVLVSLLYLFNIEKRELSDAMATITGIFYVVFFSFHVTLVDQAGPYGLMIWLIVITAFGTDIMAYFSGYFLGKHKLCPKISPIHRRHHRKHSAQRSVRILFHAGYDNTLSCHRPARRNSIPVWRSYRVHIQKKDGHKRLRKFNTGTWRNTGQV